MKNLAIAAIIQFLLYNIAFIVYKKEIPSSLSDSFYILSEKSKIMGFLFTYILWATAMGILPYWLDITEESCKFVAFGSAGLLCLVGAAPYFKSMDKGWHSVFAIGSGILCVIWQGINLIWIPIIVSACLMTLIGFLSGTLRKCKTYWIEMVMFLSMFASIITK